MKIKHFLAVAMLFLASFAFAQTTKINPATMLKPGGNSTFLLTDGSGNVLFANAATLLTGGTGISISGNTVTNSAPDQTVSFAGGGGITGTYPSFTVDAELVGLAGLSGTGFPAMTGAGAFTNRSLAIGTDASGLTGTWTNPAGTAGNPTLAIETGALAWKRAVRVATTANITLSANQTIDGVATSTGDRVLVKNQTTASANGIYITASGAWTRAGDADAASEFDGQAVFVREGTANGDAVFALTNDGAVTVGTTSLVYERLDQTLTAGDGTGDDRTITLSRGGGTVTLAEGSGIALTRSGQTITIASSASAPTVTIQRYEEVLGSNGTTVTVSGFTPLTTDTMVFVDGVHMDWGAGEDITVSGSVITFSQTILAGQKVLVKKITVN
ncbi:MAG: hypothetical protein EPGJADBJ_04491 [Saprospiraceae bacterium]|nr:hypothetical protein [Saprospiraceae bacterium]